MGKIIYLQNQNKYSMTNFTNELEDNIRKYDYSNFSEIRIRNVPKKMAQRFEDIRLKKGISKSDFGKLIISDYLEKNYPEK
jgi:hypothetical protein